MGVKALLVLADGTVFEGRGFGAQGETLGEVVFNTSMAGYQEILTDPSYKGQMVIMTYTQIGNYGVNTEDVESDSVKVEGFIVKESVDFPSNWRSNMSLNKYLAENGIVGIEGIDTRALTQHIRDNGVQNGIISSVDTDPASLFDKVKKHPDISSFDLVSEVTTKEVYRWEEPLWQWSSEESGATKQEPGKRPSVYVYDFGIKKNILRHLYSVGFDVTVVPADTPAEDIIDKADGIFLSNGPGDPEAVKFAIENTKKLIGKKPLFGICLGHQILGLALGGSAYKLKFGHHGGNHPVMELATRKVEITAQNHNYCIDFDTIKDQMNLTHKNLYDGTEEGFLHKDLPIMSSQYHPEAAPGPNDSGYIFERFMKMVKEHS